MSTRRALLFSFVDRYSGLVVHTASSMVIARLLTPAEIGIYSVVMVLLGLVAAFRDLGAGQYLVRHERLTPEVLRATFTVQLMLGTLIAAVLALAAWPIAAFYREPRMNAIVWVLALNIFVTPWLAYPNAWLVREMRFGTLAVIRFLGALAHAGAAIGLVLAGQGPISLAWANLATTLVGIVTIQLIAKPGLPRRPTRQGIREVLSFGGRLTLVSLIDNFRAGSPELILARLQDLVVAGFYSRAQGLVSMFEQLVMAAVSQVAFPFFAREVRAGRPLREPFLQAMALVTGLGWPFFAGLALLAHPTVNLLYGGQWDAAVGPVRWLALAAAISLPAWVCQPPLLALGQLAELIRASLVLMALTALAVLIGAPHGLLASTQWLAVVAAVNTVYRLWRTAPLVGVSLRDLVATGLPSALLTLAAAVPPALVVWQMGWSPASHLLPLLWAVPGGMLAFGLAGYLSGHATWVELSGLLTRAKTRFVP